MLLLSSSSGLLYVVVVSSPCAPPPIVACVRRYAVCLRVRRDNSFGENTPRIIAPGSPSSSSALLLIECGEKRGDLEQHLSLKSEDGYAASHPTRAECRSTDLVLETILGAHIFDLSECLVVGL